MILNRLKKNLKKRQAWTKQSNIQAFRLYDKDIPEYPFLVDVYKDHFVIYDKGRKDSEKDQQHLEEIIEAITKEMAESPNKVIVKSRHRLRNRHQDQGDTPAQYQKLADQNLEFIVEEGDQKFLVNLTDYLDTGLFLDHRPLRQKIRKHIKSLKKQLETSPTFLNLFCYTGAVSVCAAAADAKTTSVDMSNTYLDWAKRNFEENRLFGEHKFLREDVLKYLNEKVKETYDIVYCDPPTFSNSKKMEESFEIEREQLFLITSCMKRLKSSGTLYFSTNKRDFKLSPQIAENYLVRETTAQTIPKDYHDQKIHHSYEIRHQENTN